MFSQERILCKNHKEMAQACVICGLLLLNWHLSVVTGNRYHATNVHGFTADVRNPSVSANHKVSLKTIKRHMSLSSPICASFTIRTPTTLSNCSVQLTHDKEWSTCDMRKGKAHVSSWHYDYLHDGGWITRLWRKDNGSKADNPSCPHHCLLLSTSSRLLGKKEMEQITG